MYRFFGRYAIIDSKTAATRVVYSIMLRECRATPSCIVVRTFEIIIAYPGNVATRVTSCGRSCNRQEQSSLFTLFHLCSLRRVLLMVLVQDTIAMAVSEE